MHSRDVGLSHRNGSVLVVIFSVQRRVKIAKNLQGSHYGLRGRCNRGRKTAIVNIASVVVSIAPVVVLIMV